MLCAKNLIFDYREIPSTWVFENYCNLTEKLNGQDIKIKSLFNSKEKTPSMCIYFNKNSKEYKFKDFSTGKGGSHIELVKQLFDLNINDTIQKIIGDYNTYILKNKNGYNQEELKYHAKYKVSSSLIRNWNTRDQQYWTQFNIGSKLLNAHCVSPLDSYTMAKKNEDGTLNEIVISGEYIYGYFKKDGSLYKIYQPKINNKKFLKVKNYIQGSEQLESNNILIITSSLKDILSLKSLKLKIDYIAPDSENTMVSADDINFYKDNYKHVLTLLDNDDAGIKAMKKYRELYGISPVLLTLSKDPSDSIRDYGTKKVLHHLIPWINKAIEN
jgi:hypothetical protein